MKTHFEKKNKTENEWFCVCELQTCENMHIALPLSCHSGMLVIFLVTYENRKNTKESFFFSFLICPSATLCPLIGECLDLLTVDV